ncbi:MAG: ABC transporter substrate-binding protein [Alphaproteobacteria bacterium]|nr:ABC transporter substrate-binding protein [Alphaproteobacteria bacterium]
MFHPSRRAVLAGTSALALGALAGPRARAQAPRRGGSLILALEGEPTSLTSHLATDTPAMMVANNIFNALVLLDEKLQPIPDLAQRWTVSPDGLTYTFELVQNATWHDGKPVTAADVEYTFNEILSKVHPRAGSWWPNVASARATGTHTFVFTLKAPFAPFLTMLGSVLSSGATILPKHIYEGTDPRTNPANARPIGSGAFRFQRWQRGSHIELVRNERYWKPNRPYLDRLVLQVLPDPAARLLAFERGEVDFLHWYIVPYDRVGQMRRDPRFQLLEKGDAAATNGLMLYNHRHQHLRDVRVRQAIAHAINRQTIRDRALFGEGKVAQSHIGSNVAAYFTPDFDYAFDPAKANAMLDEAGLRRGSDGRRFAVRIFWASGRDYEGRGAEIIRDNLRDVGVEATVQVFDRPSFIDRVFRQWDFDLAMQLFTTGPDPTISVTPRYHTRQIQRAPFVNGMGYSNPETDRLFDAEYRETDVPKRAAVWRDIQRNLMRDLPALPLFELPPIHAASAKFGDVVTGPQGYIQSREDAYQR